MDDKLAALTLHPRLVEADRAIAKAEAEYEKVLAEVQAACPHAVVIEHPWSEYANAKRVCVHCRKLERGSHWSGGSTWSEENYGPSIMGNTATRVVIPKKEVATLEKMAALAQEQDNEQSR